MAEQSTQRRQNTIPCAFCTTEAPAESELKGWVLAEGWRYACPECVQAKRHIPPKPERR